MRRVSRVPRVLLTFFVPLILISTAGCAATSTSSATTGSTTSSATTNSTTSSATTNSSESSNGALTGENDKMKDAFDALMKRPSITEIEVSYQSMFQTIRERLTAEIGVGEWVPDDQPIRGSACGGDNSNLDGAVQRSFDAGSSRENLPDAKWDRAVDIVTEVASQHGFGAPEVIVNRPSDHEVSFRDLFNGELLFGTGANTILAAFTDCHLTEEAHQRGTYQPPEKR